MSERPTLFLTNAASRRPPHRGPGRVLTIMAAPRPQYGEAGVGVVNALVPPLDWVQAAKAGTMPMERYRDQYLNLVRARSLAPGFLWFRFAEDRSLVGIVGDGDTLVCACSRAAAAAGRCHRCWAAEVLLEAGWRVVLDGRELEVPDAV